MRAASLKTGTELWNKTIDETGMMNFVADHGKVAFVPRGSMYCLAFNLQDGSLAWKSELVDYPWGQWLSYYGACSAYGLLYELGYDGIYAFNWTNGKIVWKYEAPAAFPYESPYVGETGQTVYPCVGGLIADGKLYAYNTEHTVTQPITRGWGLHCINATTGEGIWNITGVATPGAVADGYLAAGSLQDGSMYVFGKGKSATTVSAPQTSVPKGTTVLIQGAVLDMSPAQPGTPCVSKESMATYMEYLHMQKPIPDGYVVTGVPVTLLAIGSDSTVIDIGTVKSDLGGFRCEWIPPDEDLYTITASFMGDDSYGSSWAATALSVGPAPEEPTEPAAQEDIDRAVDSLTPMFLGIIVAVAVAIIIGIVSILDHRRMRK